MIREFSWIDVFYLVAALRWTLALAAVAFLGGSAIGAVIALLRFSLWAPLALVGVLYTQLVQGTPLLVWIFGLYFGLAIFGPRTKVPHPRHESVLGLPARQSRPPRPALRPVHRHIAPTCVFPQAPKPPAQGASSTSVWRS